MLLWTNSNPGAAFAAQTVSLDLTEYAGVIVEYNISELNTQLISRIYLKKNDNLSPLSGWYFGAGAGTNRAFSRGISQINNEGISFLDCVDGVTNPTNTGMIPTKIYGVKEYIVEPQTVGSVYYLGTGTSFDIKTLLPTVDYAKLTSDNFIVGCNTSSSTPRDNKRPGNADLSLIHI